MIRFFDCSFQRKSLGYDCLKNQNLIQIDSNTLAFASGNFLHFLDVSTKQISSRRSISNAGIACLTVGIRAMKCIRMENKSRFLQRKIQF